MFAQCTQSKYRNLSTNNMRRYWSWILLWQYFITTRHRYVFFCNYKARNLEWNWYGSMEDCLPFHSWNLPFHSILASSIFHTKISVPFHFPFHSLPCSASDKSDCRTFRNKFQESVLLSIRQRHCAIFSMTTFSAMAACLLLWHRTDLTKQRKFCPEFLFIIK